MRMPTSTTTTTVPDVTTVRLPHTGLRVPDHSLSISRYKELATSDGVAFTANLRVNNKIVGVIENSGHGGMTLVFFHDRRSWGDVDLAAHAAQCRTEEGEPVNSENLVDELVNEHDFAAKVAAAQRRGRTVLRMMGYILSGDDRAEGFPPYPQDMAGSAMPRSDAQWAELTRLVQNKLAPHADAWWQAWTGQQWRDITPRPAGTDPELYQ